MPVSPEYWAWQSMIQRCYNPKRNGFHNYGGRGIKVCEEWLGSFELFLAHVGFRPSRKYSIDRMDNDKNYEPGNVKWATLKEQGNNRRTNQLITFQGETRTVTQWAELLGIKPETFRERITRYGWSLERAMTEPVHPHRVSK